MADDGDGAQIAVARGDLQTLLVSAVGYALGRKSYVVNEICLLVRRYHAALGVGDVRTMLRYIEAQAAWGYGDACDYNDWMTLKAFLEGREEEWRDGLR